MKMLCKNHKQIIKKYGRQNPKISPRFQVPEIHSLDQPLPLSVARTFNMMGFHFSDSVKFITIIKIHPLAGLAVVLSQG